MAKILKDKELGEIVYRATHDEGVIDDQDSYLHFLEDLGNLIADHFGGERGGVDYQDDLGYCVAFHVNECVPSDGGVFKDYDTDVSWVGNEETDEGESRTSVLKKIRRAKKKS